MSYDLIEKDAQYLSELKIMSHTGSGPVDPAPKEKETKSPVEDEKGQGTEQAGTEFPNKIPPLAALKKYLAKEGIEISGETPKDIVAELRSLSEDKLTIAKKLIEELSPKKVESPPVAEIKEVTLADELEFALEMCGKDHKKEKVKEAEEAPEGAEKEMKDEKENEEAEEEIKEQDEAAEVEADSDAEEKNEVDDEKAEGGEAEKEMEEQMSLKNQARMSGASDDPAPVAGSPAEKAARMSANVPPAAIQKMRRPVPMRAANVSDRVKGQQFQKRPVRMGRL